MSALSLVGFAEAEQTNANESRKPLPDWEEGLLDIHHISTGRGDAAFIICPDGTTMMIDVGDLGKRSPEVTMPALPDDSQCPGKWVADYVRRFSRPLGEGTTTVDYVFLTHFHGDHIGTRHPGTPTANGYALSGITMFAEHVAIGKLVDRGFPNYDFPSREAVKANCAAFFDDYLKFVEHQHKVRKTVFEIFDVGSHSQFALKRNPEKYDNFRIQNLYINGEIWTGKGTEKATLIPRAAHPGENPCSGAVEISYGNFRYFSGGDITGLIVRDVETALSKLLGKTSVLNLNHHGYRDAINETFLAKLRPQVMVVPAWDAFHPHVETLARMTDTSIYPDQRSIYTTGMFPGLQSRLGDGVQAFKPFGHIVVRVGKGGKDYTVFVLDATSKSGGIICSEEFIA